MSASSRFIDRAEQAAGEAETWADLSNFLFDPSEALIARAYPLVPRGASGLREDRGVPEAAPTGRGLHGPSRARRRRDAEEERPIRRASAPFAPRGAGTARRSPKESA